MTEAPMSKPFEQPPSRIPVPISRRQSLNLDSGILQRSTSLSANGTDGRPASAQGVHKMPAGRIPPSRRQSMLTNAMSRRSSSSGQGRDPGDQAELREAFRRSSEIYSSEVTIPSPTIPSIADGEPWTTRLENLPEDDAVSPGPAGDTRHSAVVGADTAESRIPRRPSSAQSNESGPSRGIPHSNSSYDLRGRAVTPGRETNGSSNTGKYGTSRIPQSTVMNAVSLHPTPTAASPISPGMYTSASPTPSDPALRSPFLGVESPNPGYNGGPLGLGLPSSADGRSSPLRRSTAGSAASTKVIDGLQTEVQHLKVVLEKTRQDLRSSQRVVGSLTRATEDLKDTKDRLKGEIDAVTNVLKRRDRLLQETVERARSAEAELHEIKSTRKALEQNTKKQLQNMTAQVTEATFAQTKSDKECAALKDSVRSLREAWAREMKAVRDEWRKNTEREVKEREEARLKHMALAKLVQSQSADRQAIQTLAADVLKQSDAAAAAYEEQLAGMRAQVEQNDQETKAAQAIAQQLASELVHLRRLMRASPRDELVQVANGQTATLESAAAGSEDQ